MSAREALAQQIAAGSFRYVLADRYLAALAEQGYHIIGPIDRAVIEAQEAYPDEPGKLARLLLDQSYFQDGLAQLGLSVVRLPERHQYRTDGEGPSAEWIDGFHACLDETERLSKEGSE